MSKSATCSSPSTPTPPTVVVFIQISLKFVPRSPNDNKPAFSGNGLVPNRWQTITWANVDAYRGTWGDELLNQWWPCPAITLRCAIHLNGTGLNGHKMNNACHIKSNNKQNANVVDHNFNSAERQLYCRLISTKLFGFSGHSETMSLSMFSCIGCQFILYLYHATDRKLTRWWQYMLLRFCYS